MFIFTAFAAALIGTPALAFHLDDHTRITVQAHEEFARCFPNQAVNQQAFVDGILSEDTDLITKLLLFSHFYSPKKSLNLWRSDSAGRIADLEPALLQCRQSGREWSEEETADLGHMIHHYQDMAVPSHVVPVKHSFFDGFERYVVPGDVSSGWNCNQIAASRSEDLQQVLKETALTTLGAVARFKVEGVDVGVKKAVNFSGFHFWQESSDDGFGDYGFLGNAFGATELIETDDGSYYIPEDGFREFKLQQMKLAVQATLRGMAWAFLAPKTPIQIAQ